MTIRPYQEADQDRVVALWRVCHLVTPQNDPYQDIQSKILIQPELFLIGLVDGEVVATVMAGYEGHRGWLNYVAVSPDCQRQGLGRLIVKAAEAALAKRGCPKVNLQIRVSNQSVVEFYRALGYSVDKVVSMGKRI